MATPRVLVLRSPGTNCDGETTYAFELAGAAVEKLHINALRENPDRLQQFQILALPGGFSYGDDVAAGKILATQLEHFLTDAIREFRDSDKLAIGICNGFQTLLKAGLLVPPNEEGPLATLAHNESGRFHDRWIALDAHAGNCPFLKGVGRVELPIAHGEGRFVCRQEWIAKGLAQAGQVALTYSGENPNGSQDSIAGLCDATGRVLGLMPHPERHVLPTQHPHWSRNGLKAEGDGLAIFRNAVAYFA